MIRERLNLKNNSKGFTLVELMIVVAIIAILAAIAIPQYKKFQLKSKQSEVYANFDALKACEESFVAEHDSYVGVGQQEPNGVTLGPGKHSWTDGADNNGYMDGTDPKDFEELGFVPSGAVYAQYFVTVGESTGNSNSQVSGGSYQGDYQDYVLEAATNLDGDTKNCEYALWPDANNNGVVVSPGQLATHISLNAGDKGRIKKGYDDF